jgi:signal transduction histidine kinase
LHKLLERQLRIHFGQELPDLASISDFLVAVDTAYAANDADRALLERSIELTSTELGERNQQLERELEAIRRLELELRQAEKLRAVGQLAAGIAHEINTPIQFVGDSVHFLRSAFGSILESTLRGRALLTALDAGADIGDAREAYRASLEEADADYLLDEAPKAFSHAVEGLNRVAQIVTAMKEFGRPDQRDKTVADINRCVESTLTVAHNELKYAADVTVDLGNLPLIACYPGDLSQVVLNLLVNAAHAVSDRFGVNERGRIRVETRHEGDSVVIRISDTGSGIAEEHRARLFEPFFTTKALGRGTGQGLAISRSIVVEKHGGSLSFRTELGVGTTFEVRLPIS